jgi:hypothetical protein
VDRTLRGRELYVLHRVNCGPQLLAREPPSASPCATCCHLQLTTSAQSLTASTARVAKLEAELRHAQADHVALQTKCETVAARVAHLREMIEDLEADIAEKGALIHELIADMSTQTSESLAEERRLKNRGGAHAGEAGEGRARGTGGGEKGGSEPKRKNKEGRRNKERKRRKC